jgi:predicted nucleotidyltransferase
MGCQCFLEGIFQHKVDLVLRSAPWPKFREHVLAEATYV